MAYSENWESFSDGTLVSTITGWTTGVNGNQIKVHSITDNKFAGVLGSAVFDFYYMQRVVETTGTFSYDWKCSPGSAVLRVFVNGLLKNEHSGTGEGTGSVEVANGNTIRFGFVAGGGNEVLIDSLSLGVPVIGGGGGGDPPPSDSTRYTTPLIKWAGGLLSRSGALTGDRNCCCCEPAFCVRYFEYPFTGPPDSIGPTPFPSFGGYYTGPGLNKCVFELAHGVENCESTAGERLYRLWIAVCCDLTNYNGDINVFFSDEIDPRMDAYWLGIGANVASQRKSLIYCFECDGLTHETWIPSPINDLPNPYPPFAEESCPDGYIETQNSSALSCADVKRNKHCCQGEGTPF